MSQVSQLKSPVTMGVVAEVVPFVEEFFHVFEQLGAWVREFVAFVSKMVHFPGA